MRNRDKVVLGTLAGVGAICGARAWQRSRRRIELADRVVIVTGATSGHGFLVAQYAAERGAHLVLAARDAGALSRAEADLARLGARSVLSVPTDVTDQGQVRNLVDRTVARHGRVDVLVNNAGVISVGPLETVTIDEFREVMAVNFWGPLYATLAVLPHMRERRFGRIANVVSVGGLRAVPRLLPYSASKFALTGLTGGLRAELARDNILVTGIYPSTMRTGGHAHAWFKGNREAEYTWFALSDTIPGLSISAQRVAEKLWDGVCHGDAEVLVGWPTHLVRVLNGLFPNLVSEMMTLVDRMLPPPTNLEAPATQGQDLGGTVPGLLNRAIPPGTRPGTV